MNVGDGVKAVERILIKMVIIQGIFLILCQFVFHHLGSFPELNELTHYEGVNEQNFTKALETFNKP